MARDTCLLNSTLSSSLQLYCVVACGSSSFEFEICQIALQGASIVGTSFLGSECLGTMQSMYDTPSLNVSEIRAYVLFSTIADSWKSCTSNYSWCRKFGRLVSTILNECLRSRRFEKPTKQHSSTSIQPQQHGT